MATTKKPASRTAAAPARLGVPKTYKLFIGGKFPRSESGRSYEVVDLRGEFLANASLASRKDARDAVAAARKAVKGWSGATAYNRGQVLYRIAEVLDGRRDQFVAELVSLGATQRSAVAQVDAAIGTWIFHAGFSDKYAQVLGSANPVAAPYFNFSLPEPTGVVAIVAPQDAGWSLRGLAATIAPAIVSGNAVVVVAHETNPLSAISFAEVLATSDVPAGVVNILTGSAAELAPHLASHMDVNAVDLAGVDDSTLAIDLEVRAAENLKRVVRPRTLPAAHVGTLDEIQQFTELKTVWHPIGV
ncbi:MAG: aldehyde dehydrogenase family protein [Thermoleophilia bacterium]|nr:aldehyde dehydrogenase family protein [Thermoleophilia bacterium]